MTFSESYDPMRDPSSDAYKHAQLKVEQIEADARALWAVRVLDRWALWRNGSWCCFPDSGRWTCSATATFIVGERASNETATGSRVAAAEALVAGDSTLGENL